MSELGIQEKNGNIGESLTLALLLKHFWVMKRTPDVDGADFLVQLQHSSLEKLRASNSEIQVLGIVQSKYFQEKNEVKVHRQYVLDNDEPRSDFFCLLHTEDAEGEDVTYFFNSQDIVDSFRERGEYFLFSLTKERIFSKYRSLKKTHIVNEIKNGILKTKAERNKAYINKLFRIVITPTQHNQQIPNFTYQLRIIDDVRVVLCKDNKSHHKHLLEMRRDLYINQGEYFWGSKGVGSKFLAVSILAHHLNGMTPSNDQISLFIDNIISKLNSLFEHVIETKEILAALNGKVDKSGYLEEKSKEFLPTGQGYDYELFKLIDKVGNQLKFECKDGKILELKYENENLLSKIDIVLRLAKSNLSASERNVLVGIKHERDVTGNIIRIYDLGPVILDD